jgi:predicted PurR-regulated permease PerM
LRPGSWTRGRIIFLALSAAVVLALLVWAREVLLPFVLALIIAYVLTPLVAACERVRVPRAAAILLVYATTLSTLYLALALIFPRIASEAQKLIADTPAMARDLSTEWAPRADAWVQGILNKAHVTPSAPKTPPGPAIEVVRQKDGTFHVDIGAGLEVVQHGPGHWHVGPVGTTPTKFSVSDLMGQGIDEAFRYVKSNALDIIAFGRAVIGRVARGIFLLFMTLMVAGYVMHTREAILGFFRSLVPATARVGFDHLLWRIDRGLAGVVRGQLLICLVNGIVSAIGFGLFGLKYWPILAIVDLELGSGRARRSHPRILGRPLGLALDHRHPPDRSEPLEPQDHRRRRQDPPGAGGARARRRRALFRPLGCPARRAGPERPSKHLQSLPVRVHARRTAGQPGARDASALGLRRPPWRRNPESSNARRPAPAAPSRRLRPTPRAAGRK